MNEDTPEVASGKEAMRRQFAEELKAKLRVLRKANPKLTLEQALGQLKGREPGFFARMERIERGDWSAAGGEWSHSGAVSSFGSSGRRLNAGAADLGRRLGCRSRCSAVRSIYRDRPGIGLWLIGKKGASRQGGDQPGIVCEYGNVSHCRVNPVLLRLVLRWVVCGHGASRWLSRPSSDTKKRPPDWRPGICDNAFPRQAATAPFEHFLVSFYTCNVQAKYTDGVGSGKDFCHARGEKQGRWSVLTVAPRLDITGNVLLYRNLNG